MSLSSSRSARWASVFSAAPKVTLSKRVTKPMTSPETSHPKQWKSPFEGVITKEGVFSSWKGHEATSVLPFFLISMPRSAMTSPRAFAFLMRSIPSFVTCCISLLLTDGVKRPVLQSLELELEVLEIHDGLAAVVLPLRLLGPVDAKHRRSTSVHPSDFHVLELAPSHERVRSQEEVIGLDQRSTSFSRKPAPLGIPKATSPCPLCRRHRLRTPSRETKASG